MLHKLYLLKWGYFHGIFMILPRTALNALPLLRQSCTVNTMFFRDAAYRGTIMHQVLQLLHSLLFFGGVITKKTEREYMAGWLGC
jgi:hypothetical protein